MAVVPLLLLLLLLLLLPLVLCKSGPCSLMNSRENGG
jgi:hypothetical protein